MKKKIQKFLPLLPFLYIFLVWGFFAKPYVLDHKIPFPSTYLVNHSLPWSLYNKFWGPVKNDAMPDVVSQLYPWKKLTIEIWKSGAIPLWNPYSFSGTPLLANYQSAALSPFNLLFFVFPFNDAWSLLILFQPLVASIFLYLFARSLGISKLGSLIAGIAFMFCGFMVVWMAYGTLSMVIAFLPLMLFSVEKFVREKGFKYAILLSISIALSLISGHFQTSLYSLLVVFGYIGVHYYRERDHKIFILLFVYVLLGIFLAMPQLLPTAELYIHSVRSSIFTTAGGIPFWAFVTLFAPDFYGNPVTRNAIITYIEWASFVGIVPLFLACSTFFIRRNPYGIFFQIVAVASFLLVMDSPIQLLIQNLHIPVISTSTPSRMIVIFSFSLCVLAGFGMDAIISAIKKREMRSTLVSLSVMGGILMSVWISLFLFKPFSLEQIIVAKRNFLLPSILFFAVIVLIGVSYVVHFRYKATVNIMAVLLIMLATVDSLRFVQKWIPFDPASLAYPQLMSLEVIKKTAGTNRVFGRLGNEVVNYFEIFGMEGYDPLYIKRYGEFIRSSATGEFTQAERSVVNINKLGKFVNRINDLLSVAVIFHPKADTVQTWAFPVGKDPKRFSLVYKDYVVWLYKNTTMLPRPKLYSSYEVIKDEKAIINRLYSSQFDYKNRLIVETPIAGVPRDGSGNGSARFIKYTPHMIEIVVQTSAPALLFLSDNFYPGWQAYIDGQKTQIFRTDYTFQSVTVGKGRHRVIFRYEPLSFTLGVVFLGIGLIGLLFLPRFKKQLL